MMRLKNKIGQSSISEYAIVLSLVALAFLGTQTYFKRGVQAFVKNATDEIGIQTDSVDVFNLEAGQLLTSDSHSRTRHHDYDAYDPNNPAEAKRSGLVRDHAIEEETKYINAWDYALGDGNWDNPETQNYSTSESVYSPDVIEGF